MPEVYYYYYDAKQMIHLLPNSTSFADKLLSFCQVHLPPLHIMQLTTIVPILLCLFMKLECLLHV
jgi:hypothetical protein